jgi:tripartite-type tricarboxylate transporter receptor subunit TctC
LKTTQLVKPLTIKEEEVTMKRFLTIVLMIVLVSVLIFGVSAKSVAGPVSAAEFYKKNVVTMLVGFNPGGGSDYGGRLLASYWTAATGGAMVVKNKTGGGGIVATNYMNTAKPDGLTIAFGNFGSGFVLPHLFKDRAMKYDIKKLNFLVGAFHEPWTLLISTKRSYESVEDLKNAKGLKFSALNPSGPGGIVGAFFIDILGLDARLITGYKGGSAMGLAAGKGEVDVIPNPLGVGINSMKKGFVKTPVVVVDSKRSDIFPDTPAVTEIVKFTPKQQALFKMVDMASYILRVAAAPPGVPEDRVNFMRDAFAKIVAMRGFNNQAKLNFPMGPTPLLGNELDAFVAEAASLKVEPVTTMVKKYLSIK